MSGYDPGSEGAQMSFKERMSYSDYLHLEKILDAQAPLSAAHDELLFIIQHQTSELWMKLAIHEIRSAKAAHREEVMAELEKILAEPSLYDEALLLLDREGFDIGPDAKRTDWRQSRQPSDQVMAAWKKIYQAPAEHWALYELAEKLVDFEDYFRRWRFNHVTTVERIIGLKRGTGGTAGVSYLRKMLEVELFPELWKLRTEL
jgi:tryptophan 2,3-dioxygenase